MTEIISRGAQFKGFVSLIGLIIFPFALILSIVALVHLAFIPGILLLTLSTAMFFLFLDVRGVEIDRASGQIRRYKQYMWFRWGEWKLLSDYHEIHLIKDSFYVHTMMTGMSTGAGMRRTGKKFSTYDIVLMSVTDDDNILLSEFAEHADAVAFMNKYAAQFNFPSRDIFKELQASAVSRRKARR